SGRAIGPVVGPFRLTLEGLGAFPRVERPQVLWLGASEGATSLGRLATALDRVLCDRGFPAEQRPYVPHLTLARIKARAAGIAAAQAMRGMADQGAIASCEVRSFSLYESVSTGGGVRYTPLMTFALEAP